VPPLLQRALEEDISCAQNKFTHNKQTAIKRIFYSFRAAGHSFCAARAHYAEYFMCESERKEESPPKAARLFLNKLIQIAAEHNALEKWPRGFLLFFTRKITFDNNG